MERSGFKVRGELRGEGGGGWGAQGWAVLHFECFLFFPFSLWYFSVVTRAALKSESFIHRAPLNILESSMLVRLSGPVFSESEFLGTSQSVWVFILPLYDYLYANSRYTYVFLLRPGVCRYQIQVFLSAVPHNRWAVDLSHWLCRCKLLVSGQAGLHPAPSHVYCKPRGGSPARH